MRTCFTLVRFFTDFTFWVVKLGYKTGNIFFESVTKFWGLATALTNQSCVHKELRINSGNAYYYYYFSPESFLILFGAS